MPRSILVDVNVPREVSERLSEMGFNATYLTDVLPEDTADAKILDWMKHHQFLLLTRDRNFPEDGDGRKIILHSESCVKLSRESLHKLMERQVFPRPLSSAWEE